MYYRLFNRVSDAIELIDRGEFEQARALLINAQNEAEETYISAE